MIATIFVNPLQFGPNEDLDRYPRTLDADLEVCRRRASTWSSRRRRTEMYPDGQPPVRVDPGPLGDDAGGREPPRLLRTACSPWCCKLLQLTRPDLAFFGEKDYQQLTLIRRMVRDLDLPVEIVGVPTVREPDGLALSSRNRYLSDGRARRPRWRCPGALRAGRGRRRGADAGAVLAAAHAVSTPDARRRRRLPGAHRPDLGAGAGRRAGAAAGRRPGRRHPADRQHPDWLATELTTDVLRTMLKSKIHRATVTQADLHYVGSVTVDEDLLDAADLLPGEQVAIVDVTNGARLETYVIPGERGSGVIGINGAAAHLVHPGDLVILISYAQMDDADGPDLPAAGGARGRRQPDHRAGRGPGRARPPAWPATRCPAAAGASSGV